MPFYNQLFRFIEEYRPLDAFVDNTGTQANTADLVNFDYYEELKEMGIRGIKGLSFASTKKIGYLRALQISVEAHALRWPKFLLKSVSGQLKNYSYEKDKSTNSKLAQDIVAVLAMVAFAIRAWRRRKPSETSEEDEDEQSSPTNPRDQRSDARSRISGRDPRREGVRERHP
jgi:hypothetical protein